MKPDQSVAAVLKQAATHLAHLPDGHLDGEFLLAHAMEKTRTWLRTWPEKTIDADIVEIFDKLVQHRAVGMPLAYLTGEREFWSLPLQVNQNTLIPRADTELLVELALRLDAELSVIVELGTGSGAIALALCRELCREQSAEMPGKTIIATDLSRDALRVAQANAKKLGCKINLIQSDWLSAMAHQSIDLIVSNPPYVANDDDHLTGDGVVFEPALALLGGVDGLDAYRHIVPQAARCLRRPGTLMVEHGYDQAAAVSQLMSEAGFDRVSTHKDHAGVDRVTIGTIRKQNNAQKQKNSG